MAAVPVWHGVVRKGKVFLRNTLQYGMYLRCFKDNTDIEVVVRKSSKTNSRNQQNYYRGVILPYIAKEVGISNDIAHGLCQRKFFTYEMEGGTEYIRSTRLNGWRSDEWEEKMEEIRRWAFDFLNCDIPKPNEVEL